MESWNYTYIRNISVDVSPKTTRLGPNVKII